MKARRTHPTQGDPQRQGQERQGRRLIAGPGEETWRMVVNEAVERWGVPIDDAVRDSDVGAGTVPATHAVGVVDLLTLELVPTGESSADPVMAWGTTRVRIPVTLSPPLGANGGG